MHKQAINHKQAIIGGGYLFTENACYFLNVRITNKEMVHNMLKTFIRYKKNHTFCDMLLVTCIAVMLKVPYQA